MDKKNVGDGMAVVLAQYLKRWLEDHGYEVLFSTDGARRLRELPPPVKYGLEFLLYATAAYADQRLPADAAWKKFIREVGMDFPAEFSSRLLRNQGGSPVLGGDIAPGSVVTPGGGDPFGDLVAWARGLTEEERVRLQALLDPGAPAGPGGDNGLQAFNARWREWLDRRRSDR